MDDVPEAGISSSELGKVQRFYIEVCGRIFQ